MVTMVVRQDKAASQMSKRDKSCGARFDVTARLFSFYGLRWIANASDHSTIAGVEARMGCLIVSPSANHSTR